MMGGTERRPAVPRTRHRGHSERSLDRRLRMTALLVVGVLFISVSGFVVYRILLTGATGPDQVVHAAEDMVRERLSSQGTVRFNDLVHTTAEPMSNDAFRVTGVAMLITPSGVTTRFQFAGIFYRGPSGDLTSDDLQLSQLY